MPTSGAEIGWGALFAQTFVMKLVAAIPGLETSQETNGHIAECLTQCGKMAHSIHDTAGFLVNWVLFAMFNEAVCPEEESKRLVSTTGF